MNDVKITRQTSSDHIEFEEASLHLPSLKNRVGRYLYFYESKRGVISMLEFNDPFLKQTYYEIMNIEPKYSLFEDVERYPTKELAEKRIMELLQ